MNTLEACAAVAEAVDRRSLWRVSAQAAAVVTGAEAAFVGVLDGATLQVPAHQGLEREQLQALVSEPSFLALVADWRDRPAPTTEPQVHKTLACAPVVVGRFVALVAAVAPPGPGEAPETLTGALTVLSRQVAATLRRLDAEELGRRRESELDNLVQSVPFPVLGVDGDGILRKVNPVACELLGLSGSFDLGRPVAGKLRSSALEALLDGSDPRFETEIELGNPSRVWRAHVGRLDSARFVVLQDVTAAARSEQVKRDLVAVMGHELRTPLTIVKGFAQTLAAKGEALDADQRAEFLASIVKQAGRLDQLIADLLFLSTENDEAALPADPMGTDVSRMAEALVKDYGMREPDRNVRVVVPHDSVEAPVDRQRLEHVLRHLLDNAIKFSDGEVKLEVAVVGGEVLLSVSDHGEGIFSGDLDRMFEAYVQLDGTSTRKKGGAGLGLYVSRRLVELMGGRLECDSRLGVGSRFTVVLPSIARATMPSGENDHVRAPGRLG